MESYHLNGKIVAFLFFFERPLDGLLEAGLASARPFGGVWEVFWNFGGGFLEAFGRCLNRPGGILCTLSPKKPSKIPKGGPKRSPEKAPESPQDVFKKAQKATQTTPKPHPS